MLFKEFGDVDAWPLCLATKDVDEIVAVVRAIAPGFGGVNLEDISAPRCFEIERRLREELDIPVFHDDQHGTAIVVLAALENALKVVGKARRGREGRRGRRRRGGRRLHRHHARPRRTRHRRLRPPAASCTRRAPDLTPVKRAYRRAHQPARADLHRRRGAGRRRRVHRPGRAGRRHAGTRCAPWRDDAIVFAMANPTPEVLPEEIPENVAVIATGRWTTRTRSTTSWPSPASSAGALDVRAHDDQRGDEARRRAGHRRRSSRRRSCTPTTSSRASSTAGSARRSPRPSGARPSSPASRAARAPRPRSPDAPGGLDAQRVERQPVAELDGGVVRVEQRQVHVLVALVADRSRPRRAASRGPPRAAARRGRPG